MRICYHDANGANAMQQVTVPMLDKPPALSRSGLMTSFLLLRKCGGCLRSPLVDHTYLSHGVFRLILNKTVLPQAGMPVEECA